ncbi:MAG: hypothetical protein SGJ17_09725 [Hyphomicrobiales bacterium]|nr:hypothetical protein [Hyphomicrobiales bacterium]
MISHGLSAIAKLRENREKNARMELEKRNRLRNSAYDAVREVRLELRLRVAKLGAEDAKFYNGVSGKALSVNELGRACASIERGRAEVGQLREKGAQMRLAATEADVALSEARRSHAALFRAKQKTAHLIEREWEKAGLEEASLEELLIEEEARQGRGNI